MIEEIKGMKDIIAITEIEVDQEKGISQEIIITSEIEVQAIVDQDQGLEPVQIRDRIRCYACREYDHFTRDCTNSREERNLEQLQQMLNIEEEGYRTESFR